MSATMETLLITSRLLGDLMVPPDAVMTMPAGLYGFEACRTFALVPAGRDGLWWLQSAEREALVFLLADPFVFFPGHVVDVPPAELAAFDATETTPLDAFVIVTLPRQDGESASANLQAPIVADLARRVARQIVLPDVRLPLAAPIAL